METKTKTMKSRPRKASGVRARAGIKAGGSTWT